MKTTWIQRKELHACTDDRGAVLSRNQLGKYAAGLLITQAPLQCNSACLFMYSNQLTILLMSQVYILLAQHILRTALFLFFAWENKSLIILKQNNIT